MVHKVRKGVVLLVKSGNEILLLKSKKDGHWGMISGGIEPGEKEVDAIVREANEEAGLAINKEDLIHTNETITFISHKGPGEQTAYYLKLLKKPIVKVDNVEIEDFGWFKGVEIQKKLQYKRPLLKLYDNITKKNS